jgi:soluble lytic murein transglycosylase-like protein
MREALEKQKASIVKQQQVVRQQAQTAGVRTAPWASAPVLDADCDPIAEAELAPLVEAAAKKQKLETKLIRAVIEKESGFHACAVSPKGAQGLMQIMPGTAQELGLQDAFDPRQNIDAGSQFLRQLLDKYGDLAKALGAYNAGPAAVDQAGAIPDISETRDYVDSIMKKLEPTRTVPPSSPTPKPIGN